MAAVAHLLTGVKALVRESRAHMCVAWEAGRTGCSRDHTCKDHPPPPLPFLPLRPQLTLIASGSLTSCVPTTAPGPHGSAEPQLSSRQRVGACGPRRLPKGWLGTVQYTRCSTPCLFA